jgi:hypothetical protein
MDKIVINGINAETGGYFTPSLSVEDVAQIAYADPEQDQETQRPLRQAYQSTSSAHLGLSFDVDARDPGQAGWAVVFHTDEDPAVKTALEPLIAHRRAGIQNDRIVKVLEYHAGESVLRWLARYRVSFGTVDPERIPYYVLVAGSPERIPFELGQMLGVMLFVGRLSFPSPDDYRRYAESVVAYETRNASKRNRTAAFFGPRHVNDPATAISAELLVRPLSELVAERLNKYQPIYLDPRSSTKQNLHELLHSPAQRPALLVTASHGLAWTMNNPSQSASQGALVCADFPGPGVAAPSPDDYFAARDLERDAAIHGLVSFHFASFANGTPKFDRFLGKAGDSTVQIAGESSVSRLPQALLAHPNGGALGVIGHVGRAWPGYISAGPDLRPFENAIGYLLQGSPLGYALRDFNERYAALSATLATVLERREFGVPVSDAELAQVWQRRNDAEAYVLFGDPAARILPEMTIPV